MKVSDKLKKVNDSFSVSIYDNGYMIEIGGANKNDEWTTAKLLCSSLEELKNIITEISSMPRND